MRDAWRAFFNAAPRTIGCMALYLIGDVQGCDAALGRLLAEIGFSPSRARIMLLGDLVNRGPASLAVLRRVRALGEAACGCLLGNHDIHLLAVAAGLRRCGRRDTLQDILAAPDGAALLDWLRRQPLARMEAGILMVHAGVLPAWDAAQTLALAAEVQQALSGADWAAHLATLFGNAPDHWDEALGGAARLRAIVNALTRCRLITLDGCMDFNTKDSHGADGAPPGLIPWFEHPARRTAEQPIAFGHWSTLGPVLRPNLMALDTGCVWGGTLSALRVGSDGTRELIQVECTQACTPG